MQHAEAVLMDKEDAMEGAAAALVVMGLLFGMMLFDNPIIGVLGGAALAIIMRFALWKKAGAKKKSAAQNAAVRARGRWAVFAGIAIITIGIYAAIFTQLNGLMKSTIVSVGTAMLAVGILMYWRSRSGEVMYDERTLKIQNKALAASWWLTYVFIAALFWVDSMGIAKFTAESFGGLLLFEMVVTYMIAKWWLGGRGDVQ